VRGDPYRWTVLAVGVTATIAYSALRMGLPALSPELAARFDLDLSGVGVVLGSVALGQVLTTYAWGSLSDRRGERLVLSAGTTGAAVALAMGAFASSVSAIVALLLVAGMLGASTVTGSGRAVLGWFPQRERGTAIGVRQMAIPLGGALAAVLLPWLTGATSLTAAFLVLAALMLVAGVASLVWMREPPGTDGPARSDGPAPVRDARIWRLAAGAACLLAAQTSILSFLVLFLHDERAVAVTTAAGFLALLQVGGALGRLAAGRWSDRSGRRMPLILAIAGSSAVCLTLSALLAEGVPVALTVAVLLAAGVLAMSWNGLSLNVSAEMSGRAQAGVALGLLTTVVAVAGAVMPPLFGLLVEAVGWRPSFAVLAALQVVAVIHLHPLVGEEAGRLGAGAA
jgi:sugar phosphate permease